MSEKTDPQPFDGLLVCELERKGARYPSGRRACSVWVHTACGVDDPKTCPVLANVKDGLRVQAAHDSIKGKRRKVRVGS